MKLGIRTIEGKMADNQAEDPYVGNFSGPQIQVAASLDLDNYTDVSGDLLKWAEFSDLVQAQGVAGMRDYLNVAAAIETLVTNIAGSDYSAWDSLSAAQKLAACQFLATKVPVADLLATVPAQDRKDLVLDNISKSQAARRARMLAAEIYLFTAMPVAARQQLVKDLYILRAVYIEAGVVSFAVGGVDGIADFLASTSGYSGGGLLNGGYAVNAPSTLASISAATLSILNGNY